jgi:predicted nucleotidyltransferase
MTEQVLKIWSTIEEKVLDYLKDVQFDSLIAHGSFAEGTANQNSDFDLFVIFSAPVEERVDVIRADGIEVDLEFVNQETLKMQLDTLDDLLVPTREVPLATRLKNAVVLIDHDNVGRELVEMAQKYCPSSSLMERYSRCGLSLYYDAVGSMASGKYDTAVHMARIGGLYILIGILLKKGVLYVNKKWLTELAKRTEGAPADIFLRLSGLSTVDKEQAFQSIGDLKRLISEFENLKEEVL